jgi:hypothetical protein
MRCVDRWISPTVTILALGLSAWSPANAQDAEVAGHTATISSDGSLLQFELTDGSHLAIRFANGTVYVNDDAIGNYKPGSALAQEWGQLLNQAGRLSSDELIAAIRDWEPSQNDSQSAKITERIADRVSQLEVTSVTHQQVRAEAEAAQEAVAAQEAAAVAQTAAGVAASASRMSSRIQQLDQFQDLGIHAEDAQIHMGDLTIPRGTEIQKDLIVLSGDVSVFGTVHGTLVALDGDVILHRNGRVMGDVVTINGRLTRAGGRVDGNVRSSGLELKRARSEAPQVTVEKLSPAAHGTTLASILGMFVALACIGFGFTFFAPRQLDVVSETVTESFGKSFLAGLFTTPLVVPAFAMLLVGLAITIVGVLLIPFAILGGIVAVTGAAVGGYLAVAKSVGSTVLTRRMAQGHATTVTPYKSLVIGLLMLMTIWLPAGLLGWIPIVGQLFTLLAFVFTWVMVTAGVGAAVLSRAGLRATFVTRGRPPALTDEYYWPAAEPQSLPRSRDRV